MWLSRGDRLSYLEIRALIQKSTTTEKELQRHISLCVSLSSIDGIEDFTWRSIIKLAGEFTIKVLPHFNWFTINITVLIRFLLYIFLGLLVWYQFWLCTFFWECRMPLISVQEKRPWFKSQQDHPTRSHWYRLKLPLNVPLKVTFKYR